MLSHGRASDLPSCMVGLQPARGRFLKGQTMRAYQGKIADVLRDVLADVFETDGIEGACAAYNAEQALAKEAKRLRRESMIDTARRIEVVVRALHVTVPTTA